MEWDILVTVEFLDWINSPDFLRTILLIVEKSKGDWERKPHKEINLEIEDIACYTHVLLHNAMIGYFIGRYHMLPSIKRWAELTLCRERNWPIQHVNFFVRIFICSYSRNPNTMC